MKNLFICFMALLTTQNAGLLAQMMDDQGVFYGNEWVDNQKTYYKILVNEDGIYHIGLDELQSEGFPVSSVRGSELQLFHFGEEVPIRVSSEESLTPNDYIEFVGFKNKGELDKHLYVVDSTVIYTYDQDSVKVDSSYILNRNQLNPEYSLYNDNSAYFLTWDSGTTNRRYEQVNTEVSDNLPPAETSYQEEVIKVFSDQDIKRVLTGSVRYSSFRSTEGFGSPLENTTNIEVEAKNISEIGSRPEVEILFSGNANTHTAEISLNGTRIKNISFGGYELINLTEDFDIDLLQENNTITIFGKHSGFDKMTVGTLKLRYPKEYKFDGSSSVRIRLPSTVFSRYLELQDFDVEGGEVHVYDKENAQFFPAVIQDGLVKILIPGANGKERDLIVINSSKEIKSSKNISQRTMVDYTQMDPSFIIISSKVFTQSGATYLQDYADYRSSEKGGDFVTTIVYVEDLYDQFAYGIDRHPLAIKNFINAMDPIWTKKEYVFLVGKGFEYPDYRTEEDFTLTENQYFTVPTFGVPGSDNLLLSYHWNNYPIVPIGRLPIRTSEELGIYLDKVKEHEDFEGLYQIIEDQLWRKRILHLSGGDTKALQETIFEHLRIMGIEIESNSYGGNVTTFRKTNSEPIQSSESTELFDLINNGVSIITFFGHSSNGTFDFSLEQPSKYENEGKYPLIMSLGCFSGNIHTSAIGISEDFVIEDDRGAIAFIAASGSGSTYPQFVSGRNIYANLGSELLGKSIGTALYNSLWEIGQDNSVSAFTKTLNEQLTLNGDQLYLYSIILGLI